MSNRTADDDKYWEFTSQVGFSFRDEGEESDSASDQLFYGGNKERVRAAQLNEEFKAEAQEDCSLFSTTSDNSNEFESSSSEFKFLPSFILPSSDQNLHTTLDQEIDKDRDTHLGYEDTFNKKHKVSYSGAEGQSIDFTIRQLLICEDVSLEHFKSFDQKKSLFHKALEINDGNAILTVILFLSRTLRPLLFRQLLLENKQAINHYIHYLETKHEIFSLLDLLNKLQKMMIMNEAQKYKEYEIIVRYKQILKSQDDYKRINRDLELFYQSDIVIAESFYASIIKQQISVIATHNVIKEKNPNFKNSEYQSILKTLGFLSEHFFDSVNPLLSHLSYKSALKPKQYSWIVLLSLVKAQSWPQIENLLLTKSWLGGMKDKCILPLEDVCLVLRNAPIDLITRFVKLIDDNEKKLTIAKKLKCHLVVIDIYSTQKDRGAILRYRTNLEENSKEAFYCDSVLKNQTIKWKN